MKTLTTLTSLYTSLSQNSATANTNLGQQLISDQHRYTMQRFFDNERTVQLTTVGGMSLTLTGAPLIAATTATLTAVWAYPTVTQLVNFSNSDQRSVLFTNNSASLSWVGGLSSAATTAITSVGAQSYAIPANISKIKNNTISVGQLKYMAAPVNTIQEWTLLNTLPYTSNIVNYFFIYNGNLLFFPIPSTTGLIIEINYKARVPDLSFADYTTGHIANAGMVVGTTAVTGVGTTWSSEFPLNTDVSFFNLMLRADPSTGGDGLWYPISKFTSDTSLTLSLPVVNAPSITASTTYTIGQIPLLSEDFHDMLVYGALVVYFSSVKKDPEQFKLFDGMYKERHDLLEDYAGQRFLNVDLGVQPLLQNPNLFYFGN